MSYVPDELFDVADDARIVAREIAHDIGIHSFGLWNFRMVPDLRDAYDKACEEYLGLYPWLMLIGHGWSPQRKEVQA